MIAICSAAITDCDLPCRDCLLSHSQPQFGWKCVDVVETLDDSLPPSSICYDEALQFEVASDEDSVPSHFAEARLTFFIDDRSHRELMYCLGIQRLELDVHIHLSDGPLKETRTLFSDLKGRGLTYNR